MINKFVRLLLSDLQLTIKLIHPRRVKNAIKFFLFDKGNLAQLYRRYQDIYGDRNSTKHEHLIEEIRRCTSENTLFIFPIIDWGFRFQRPQHIALQLGRLGFKVFYFSTTPLSNTSERQYQLTESPAENVFLCKLRANSGLNDDLHRDEMSASTRDDYLYSLRKLMHDLDIARPSIIFQHHYWTPLARPLQKSVAGYDCMDHHVAFHEPTRVDMPSQERQMIRDCNFVVASSSYLKTKIEQVRECTLVRNGCDFATFSSIAAKQLNPSQPVVGYVGAIAEWFDIQLLTDVARLLPSWRFVLVGSYVGCDISVAKELSNIDWIGEVEYAEVANLIATFDVCIIPFKLTELTKATDPVKIYEYFSAGKPVVSTPLPEVIAIGDLVLIGDTPQQFTLQLQKALNLCNNSDNIKVLKDWANRQDWLLRAKQFELLLRKDSQHSAS